VNLTNKQIQDFVNAWKADFGETLSLEQAEAEAHRLLDFFNQMEEGLRSQRTKAKTKEDGSLRQAWMKRSRL
jgi:hypothetical protein